MAKVVVTFEVDDAKGQSAYLEVSRIFASLSLKDNVRILSIDNAK